MTKSLTEQWREGTLRGCFYWKLPNGNICTAYTDTMKDIKSVRDSDEVEVLQETPSYVEYNELVQKMHILEKKLEIATKALKEVVVASDNYRFCQSVGYKNLAEEALKEMGGVK